MSLAVLKPRWATSWVRERKCSLKTFNLLVIKISEAKSLFGRKLFKNQTKKQCFKWRGEMSTICRPAVWACVQKHCQFTWGSTAAVVALISLFKFTKAQTSTTHKALQTHLRKYLCNSSATLTKMRPWNSASTMQWTGLNWTQWKQLSTRYWAKNSFIKQTWYHRWCLIHLMSL